MITKNIVILGSTGSIGCSTLEVVDRHPDSFIINALACNSRIDLLEQQFRKYRPEYLGVIDEEKGRVLSQRLKDEKVKILIGEDELLDLTRLPKTELVINAIVGAAGLKASIETIKNSKDLGLANKESLVAGGPLFPELIKKYKKKILPIDSEHSAIWQALNSGKAEEVKNIIITASGGPFREMSLEDLANVTPEQALKHPTWEMGAKITIDSATLANKGLEVIEAVNLFQIPIEQVQVVVHPQSIIHSLVEFIDSSMIAQLSAPDMRLPISYALFWPERVESEFGALNLAKLGKMTFEEPDFEKFPALKIAFEVAKTGGTAPAVFNASNEIAVSAFLNKEISFTNIADLIRDTVENIDITDKPNLTDVLEADKAARKFAQEKIGNLVC